jgi:hypothetical protein
MAGYDPDEKLRAYGLPVRRPVGTAYTPVGLTPFKEYQHAADITDTMEVQVSAKTYVTAKEIVIPAGTPVQLAPNKISRFVPYAGVLLGVTNDTTAEWTMPLDEAIETGLVKEIEK